MRQTHKLLRNQALRGRNGIVREDGRQSLHELLMLWNRFADNLHHASSLPRILFALLVTGYIVKDVRRSASNARTLFGTL